jgi:RNA polymerase sigma-70 factor (ECF subfamily)
MAAASDRSPQAPSSVSGGSLRDALARADDRTIVDRAIGGDVRAFEVLVRRYSGLMRVYARSILGGSEDVDDVVQEAFIIAWQQLDSVQDPSVVKSWLMRIVSRRSLDRVRARRPEAALDEESRASVTGDEPENATESRSFEAAVDAALLTLPEQQRRCWVLKNVGEYSYQEIATELSIPESTVRGLLARARKRMMQNLEAWR